MYASKELNMKWKYGTFNIVSFWPFTIKKTFQHYPMDQSVILLFFVETQRKVSWFLIPNFKIADFKQYLEVKKERSGKETDSERNLSPIRVSRLPATGGTVKLPNTPDNFYDG